MSAYYVYILASHKKVKLYIGITKNLKKRISEHRNDFLKGFTERNKVKKLVYYEQCDSKESAVFRERQLKKWNTSWKIRLIKKLNPDLKDLYSEME